MVQGTWGGNGASGLISIDSQLLVASLFPVTGHGIFESYLTSPSFFFYNGELEMMLFTSSKQALGSLYAVNCLILTIIAYRFSQTICMKNLCTRRLNYNMLIVNQCGTGYFPSLS